jgi:glycosyltransferase involved in cell wall biosynthesis
VPSTTALPHRHLGDGERRAAFAYLGNLNPNKGASVLLAAMRILAKRQPGLCRLAIHGGMPFQSEAFQAEFKAGLAAVEDQVNWRGPYERDEVPRLLAEADWLVMPSIWWENAPLVIQEAFRQRRPVIASDIGGMAEAVRHETDGLLFRVGDPHALADVLERAAREPGLWDRLVAGIEAPPSLADCATAHLQLYEELLSVPHRESA